MIGTDIKSNEIPALLWVAKKNHKQTKQNVRYGLYLLKKEKGKTLLWVKGTVKAKVVIFLV